jgi:hydroxymethylpyrimidine/phosphomethylpyrimidine kinase
MPDAAPHVALSIAGSDPSGGAGLQADIKTFALLGVYGMAVPAALTVQDTKGVISVKPVPPALIQQQLDALFGDIRIGAVKTGMLLTASAIAAVAGVLSARRVKNLVIDPVMVSSSGKRLLKKDAVQSLIAGLFPLARLVTPNIDEAAVLAGIEVRTVGEAREAARRIRALGPRAVLVKGGHLTGEPVDVFFDGRRVTEFRGRRVTGKAVHGAGCVYSAAITAGLAKGLSLPDAIAEAKVFVAKAVEKARPVGKGRVPLL